MCYSYKGYSELFETRNILTGLISHIFDNRHVSIKEASSGKSSNSASIANMKFALRTISFLSGYINMAEWEELDPLLEFVG